MAQSCAVLWFLQCWVPGEPGATALLFMLTRGFAVVSMMAHRD